MSMDEPNSARQKNNNHRIAYRQKIALVLFGIIAAVFILEFLLRILGITLLFTQQREGRKSFAGARAYTILCLGDSFTWGLGAAEGRDYPHQLKALLSAVYQGWNFNVINAGISGQNSSELLFSLECNLDRYRPDLVIVMTGMNDPHNPHMHNWAMGKGGWKENFYMWLTNLRVYKLLKYAKENLEEKARYKTVQNNLDGYNPDSDEELQSLLAHAENLLKNGRYCDAWDVLLCAAKKDQWSAFNMAAKYKAQDSMKEIGKDDAWFMLILAKQYQLQGRFDEAEEMFKAALRRDPNGNYIRYELADFYLNIKRYGDFESIVREEITRHGESKKAYELLARYYQIKNNNGKFTELMQRVRRYEQITYSNINRIRDSVYGRGKPLIIMNYPEMSVFLGSTAKDAFLVDNRRTFEKLIQRRAEFFSGDDHHCNGAGYSVIAWNLFKCIVKNGVIDETSRSQR